MLGCSGAMDRGSGYSQGALREQEVLTLEAMKTEEDDGGGGNLAERDDSQEDWRRAPVQLFWVRIKGAGWAFVGRGWCLSVRLSPLAGCWLLGVGCCSALLAVWLSGCLDSGCLAGRVRQGGRAGAEGERGRGRERASERAEEEDGGRGSGRGGQAGQKSRATRGTVVEQSRAGRAAQRCARCRRSLFWSVLSAPVVREQYSSNLRTNAPIRAQLLTFPDGLAGSSAERFSSRWPPRRHFLLRPCPAAWGWTATLVWVPANHRSQLASEKPKHAPKSKESRFKISQTHSQEWPVFRGKAQSRRQRKKWVRAGPLSLCSRVAFGARRGVGDTGINRGEATGLSDLLREH